MPENYWVIVGVLFAGTTAVVGFWAGTYLALARKLDIDLIRRRMIKKIENENPGADLFDNISMIFDKDFRLLYPIQENKFATFFVIMLILSNFLLLVVSYCMDLGWLIETLSLVWNLLLVTYLVGMLMSTFFLFVETKYYLRFDKYRRELQ